MSKLFTGSWVPKAASIAGLVGAMLMAFSAQFDLDPKTVPDWSLFAVLLPILGGLFLARQNNVTSETVGAVTPPDIKIVDTVTGATKTTK